METTSSIQSSTSNNTNLAFISEDFWLQEYWD